MSTENLTKKEIECEVHKSLKKDETYIFIESSSSISELPDTLTKVLGQTELVMTLNLTPEKKMARGTAEEIMISIEQQGFHLQMPENPQLNDNPLAYANERFLDKNL